LHLVGYLYYWQMGFNSVFKGLKVTGSTPVFRNDGGIMIKKDARHSRTPLRILSTEIT